MGAQATAYRLRKLAALSGAADEMELYEPLPVELHDPRPCFCEWAHLCDQLLGRPEHEGVACACSGPVPFNVPGYTGRWGEGDMVQMRKFAELNPTLSP